MFLRKSRSTDALHAKGRSDEEAAQTPGKKSPRKLKPKRSLRFFRQRNSEQEPMPSSAEHSFSASPSAARMPGQPSAGLGITQQGDAPLASDGAHTAPGGDAAFFESHAAGHGMHPSTQPLVGGTEPPHTPNTQHSPGVDLGALRLHSPGTPAQSGSPFVGHTSPARLYKPPNPAPEPAAPSAEVPAEPHGAAPQDPSAQQQYAAAMRAQMQMAMHGEAGAAHESPAAPAPAEWGTYAAQDVPAPAADAQYTQEPHAPWPQAYAAEPAHEYAPHTHWEQYAAPAAGDAQGAEQPQYAYASLQQQPSQYYQAQQLQPPPGARDDLAHRLVPSPVPAGHRAPAAALAPSGSPTQGELQRVREGYPSGMDTTERPSFAAGAEPARAPPAGPQDEAELLASERGAHAGVAMPQLHTAQLSELGEPAYGESALPTSTSMRGLALGSGPPSASDPASPPGVALTGGAGAAHAGAAATHAGAAPSLAAVPSEEVSVTRSEGMLGASLLLYDDLCVENATGARETAVAWTYDDWFLEAHGPGASVEDEVTAVVASSNTKQLNADVCTNAMALAVFCSTLRAVPGEPYVYDMASRIPRETHDTQPLAQADAATPVMPVTARARNAELFTANRHVVLAATPRRLVAEMTSGSSPGLMEDVLLAYRPYFNAHRLQDLLFSRADWAVRKLEHAPARATAVRVLRSTQTALAHWLQLYYDEDYAPDDLLTRRLVEFASRHAQHAPQWPVSGTDAEVREGAQGLCQLVQAYAPPEPGAERAGGAPALRPSPSLRKMRSITKLFGRDRHDESPGSPPGLRARKEGTRPSHTRGASSASAHSLGAGSPRGHARRPSGQSLWESPRGRSDSVFRLGRRSQRRKTKDEEGAEDALDAAPRAEPGAGGAPDHDAALQHLEDLLEGRPSGGEVQRTRDGPIQWIPAHANASWRDAQRLSIQHAAYNRPQASMPAGWAQRGTLLLSQRSETVARQLTTIEKQLFALVHSAELTELSWDHHTVQQEQWQREYQDYVTWRISNADQAQEQLAPPVERHAVTHILVARFNRACAWVASHIVTTREPDERVAIVCKWIRIAWDCYLLGNHATLCQILFGLQSPWVARLQTTWQRVGAWEMRVFDALRRFTSPRDQFTQLRQATLAALAARDEHSVHVPFLGTFVSDLSANDMLALYIDTSLQPSMVPFYDDQELSQSWDTLLNLYRLRMKAMIVRDFVTLQEHAAHAPDVPLELPILAEALQLDTLPAAQIQSASLALEP